MLYLAFINVHAPPNPLKNTFLQHICTLVWAYYSSFDFNDPLWQETKWAVGCLCAVKASFWLFILTGFSEGKGTRPTSSSCLAAASLSTGFVDLALGNRFLRSVHFQVCSQVSKQSILSMNSPSPFLILMPSCLFNILLPVILHSCRMKGWSTTGWTTWCAM